MEYSIYGSIRNLATAPFKWLASIAQRMRNERRSVAAREELFALHDFTPAAGHGEQLAFQVNDIFLLKCDDDRNWWLVKHIPSGRKGYVPMSFVARKSERQHMEWYNVRTTRDEAERILGRDQFAPGSFIIRPSEGKHCSEALALSVKNRAGEEPEFLHYVITRRDGAFMLTEEGRRFPSITHLVQYYAGHNSGLRQPLIYSVMRRQAIEVWLIPLADVEVDTTRQETLLGSGYFGMVYKGKLRGDDVAIKTVILDRMSAEHFMREAEIARDFSHTNIVKTIGVCTEPPYIITEFLSGGNLRNYLRKTRVSPDEYLPIAQKIACAMAHLEEKSIVHRDLAARNILVGADHNTIKLADFGLARNVQDSIYYKTVNKLFPYKWTAPEAYVMDGQEGRSTTASDVWSFAVVLWELYSKGAEPYGDTSPSEIYRKVKTDNYRLMCPTGCAPQIYAKMLECWDLEPTARPTFAELHAFLLDPYAAQAQ